MRLASGVSDQYIYISAVDSSDHVTPKTGLSSFTAYRSRNGGTATAYTTPTITEVDSTNMPGLYKFLIDEDTTIDSGDETQEYAVTVKATGMDNIHRVIELYRPKITAGETLGVSSGAVTTVTTATTVTSIASGGITATSIAADAIGASELAADAATEIATAVWASATRILTAGTNIVLAKGTGVTGFNDIAATDVWAAAARTLTANTNLNDPTAAAIADAVWDELSTGHTDAGKAGEQLWTNVPAILADTNELQTDDTPAALAALQSHGDSTWATATGFSTHSAADVWAVATRVLTANTNLNDPSAAAIADAVWDELSTGHTSAGKAGEQLWTNIPAILTDTAEIGAAGAGLTSIVSTLETYGDTNWATATGFSTHSAADVWAVATRVLTANTNLNDPTAAAIRAEIDSNSTQLSGIKAKTDNLTFTVSGMVDANIQYVNDTQVAGDGGTGTEWGPV